MIPRRGESRHALIVGRAYVNRAFDSVGRRRAALLPGTAGSNPRRRRLAVSAAAGSALARVSCSVSGAAAARARREVADAQSSVQTYARVALGAANATGLPSGSATYAMRSPQGIVSGSCRTSTPAARARWKAASTSSTNTNSSYRGPEPSPVPSMRSGQWVPTMPIRESSSCMPM